MQEYLDNGGSWGWLIDPKTEQVKVDRPDQVVEVLQNSNALSGAEKS
jgi:Uma2 family endonuclease